MHLIRSTIATRRHTAGARSSDTSRKGGAGVITIKQAWERYTNDVMPSGASPGLLRSDRRAFYAGAAAILKAILELSDDEVSEAESIQQMERLVDEAQAFRAEMKPSRK